MCKIVHCKREKFDVYIGRPSIWGNPFVIGKDGTREEVVKKYRAWILTQSSLLKDLWMLKGKTISCWCAPFPCHGDVLCELIDQLECHCGGWCCIQDDIWPSRLHCNKCDNYIDVSGK